MFAFNFCLILQSKFIQQQSLKSLYDFSEFQHYITLQNVELANLFVNIKFKKN